jgi:hypothetical protein
MFTLTNEHKRSTAPIARKKNEGFGINYIPNDIPCEELDTTEGNDHNSI